MKLFHRLLAGVLALVYVYLIFNLPETLPGLAKALISSSQRAQNAAYLILGLPVLPFICFSMSERMAALISPKTKEYGEVLMTLGAWYVLGYLLLLFSTMLLYLFA